MDSRYQWRSVDGGAEGQRVLQEEEVADVGEVGLPGVDHALEDGEVDEGRGFESGSDGSSRIPRSCADGGRSCADGEGLEQQSGLKPVLGGGWFRA